MCECIYKSFLENLPYGVCIIDMDRKYKYANRFYRDVYKIHKIEVSDISIGEVVSDGLDLLINNRANEVVINERVQVYEGYINGKFVRTMMFPLFSSEGVMYAIGDVTLDISHGREMEYELAVLKNVFGADINLSCNDILTGLYSRTKLDMHIKIIENDRNLPIGVIVADVNGLKIINDTFGYDVGDKVLISLSNLLKQCCGQFSSVFRWSGDEFLVLIPNISEEELRMVLQNINIKCKEYAHNFVNLSLSCGASIMKNFDNSIYYHIKSAEEKVYRHKLLESSSLVSSSISFILMTLQTKSIETEEHTERMVKGALAIGNKMKLSLSKLDELVLATKLHDIGKIVIDENILLKPGKLDDMEYEIMKTHSEKGYRIVKASNRLKLDEVAEGVLAHHERYDGKGYPMRLKGEQIPIISRIISVVDSYDAMTNNRIYKKAISKEDAIRELISCKGKQFDPYIVDCFVNYLEYV